MKVIETTQVIGGKRYSTKTATLLAGDDYWDGRNYERGGANYFLFRTPCGHYFGQLRSKWESADDGALTPLSQDVAIRLYEQLRERRVSFEEAFPGVEIEEA